MNLYYRKRLHYFIQFGLIIAVCNSASLLHAGELGHYIPGVAGTRDFVVPDPGFYYVQYNVFYTTDTYKDRNGNEANSINLGPATINVDTNVDSFAVVPTFIWSSPWKIFGARYAAFVQSPLVNTRVQAGLSINNRFGRKIDESQWGIGDLYIKPVWLGWNSSHFALSAGYGIHMPTGKYDDGDNDNTGLGFWTHEFQTSVTWFPWDHQGTAVMLTGIYEIHQKKDGVDITPGDRFSLDYGVSQYIPINKAETMLFELGLSGYSQWQIDDDSGVDVIQALKVKDEVHALGGQIGLAYVPWDAALTFRYLREYYAESRFQGELFTLMFVKGF